MLKCHLMNQFDSMHQVNQPTHMKTKCRFQQLTINSFIFHLYATTNEGQLQSTIQGLRSCMDQPGVKLCMNALWLPNLVERTLVRSIMQCWGRRSCGVRWGHPRVKLLRNALWLLNLEEFMTKVQCNAGVKGHKGVSQGHLEVQLLRNALWLPHLVGRTLTSVVQCWGQRSCRGQRRSTRCQITQECCMATKFGRKNS